MTIEQAIAIIEEVRDIGTKTESWDVVEAMRMAIEKLEEHDDD